MRAATPAAAYRDAAARVMSERELQEHVRARAHMYGLRYYHTHDSRRSAPGFPDVILVGPGGVLWRELKTESGRLTERQRGWLDALDHAGQDAAIWRPNNLLAGIIDATMRRIAGRL